MSKLPLPKLATREISATRGLAAMLCCLTLVATFFVGIAAGIAAEENVTEDQILRALAPAKEPLTRSSSSAPPSENKASATPAEVHFVETMRGRTTRSLSLTEREEIATIARDKPNIDLEITFHYNSAEISSKSLPSVQALGKALANPELKGSTFIVAGHTDAAGGEAYNQELSHRRADSIKRYLVEKSGIAGSDLVTVGYGKSKLKDASNPMSEVNRRVQVVNMASKTTASK
jgi:outer membrane protein OmpA-like peptidoglycan-associated protein